MNDQEIKLLVEKAQAALDPFGVRVVAYGTDGPGIFNLFLHLNDFMNSAPETLRAALETALGVEVKHGHGINQFDAVIVPAKTYSKHDVAASEVRCGRPQPSDQAIAEAFWGRRGCQFHNANECGFVEEIVADARNIDAGMESNWRGPRYYARNGWSYTKYDEFPEPEVTVLLEYPDNYYLARMHVRENGEKYFSDPWTGEEFVWGEEGIIWMPIPKRHVPDYENLFDEEEQE